MGVYERTPSDGLWVYSAVRRRRQTRFPEYGSNGGGAHAVPQLLQFTHDPTVSPPDILPADLKNQSLQCFRDSWSAGPPELERPILASDPRLVRLQLHDMEDITDVVVEKRTQSK
jgi:hypothetical protein